MKPFLCGRILSVFLLLVAVFAVAGCDEASEEAAQPAPLQETNETVQLPSTQEIIEGVLNALEDITTSRFDMTMTMDMSGEVDGETGEVLMTMDFIGTLDHVSGEMKENVTISVVTPKTNPEEISMTLYHLTDAIYMLVEGPGVPSQWVKSEALTTNWNAMNPVASQAELLRGAETELIGSELVRGVDCYVLQLTPDIGQLWQTAMQQAEVTGEMTPDIDRESLEELFRSYSVTQWITKDTYFITRADIDMDVALTPGSLGYPDEEGMMNTAISIDVLLYDYDRPVSIVLPPEAEEAVEIPLNM